MHHRFGWLPAWTYEISYISTTSCFIQTAPPLSSWFATSFLQVIKLNDEPRDFPSMFTYPKRPSPLPGLRVSTIRGRRRIGAELPPMAKFGDNKRCHTCTTVTFISQQSTPWTLPKHPSTHLCLNKKNVVWKLWPTWTKVLVSTLAPLLRSCVWFGKSSHDYFSWKLLWFLEPKVGIGAWGWENVHS